MINKLGFAFAGLGIGRTVVGDLVCTTSAVPKYVCGVFVHSLQTGFLWVFCGWPVRINIVNRLCLSTNAAYVDARLLPFDRQHLFF